MADKSRVSVRLGDMRPGDNPRKDFGDIDAMAATIEATGGQPVNPPVVVRDGDVYRIIDGERRWRALVKLYGKDGTADVLCYDSCDEAEEAVAMIATDAKKELTEEERGHGFQRMIILGVPEARVAKAMRRKVEDVRKASAVAKMAPEQATMDQMIAAAEFDGKDREDVLNAKPGKWAAKAESIRRRIASAATRAEFERVIGELGLEVVSQSDKGWRSVCTAYTPKELEYKAHERSDQRLAVCPCSWSKDYWVLLTWADAERQETEEERAERELYERRKAAIRGLRRALLEDVATTDIMPNAQRVAGSLRAVNGYNYTRESLRKELIDEIGVREDLVAEAIASPMSKYELLCFIADNNIEWWRWVSELVPAACEDDFQTSEEDEWLLAQARAERARYEDEGGGDGDGAQ